MNEFKVFDFKIDAKMSLFSTILYIFIILQTVFFATTILQHEYEDHIADIVNSSPVAFDLGELNFEESPLDDAPSEVSVALNTDTKFYGSVVFVNGNKTTRCAPEISFSGQIHTAIRLSLGCYERSPSVFYTFLVEFMVSGTKTMGLMIFVYTVIMWHYMYLMYRPFIFNRDFAYKVRKFSVVKSPTSVVEVGAEALKDVKVQI